MKQSGFLKLNVRDISKGFITAFLTAFITVLIQLLQAGALPSMQQFKNAAIIGLTAGLAYLAKNWLTNTNDEFLTKDK